MEIINNLKEPNMSNPKEEAKMLDVMVEEFDALHEKWKRDMKSRPFAHVNEVKDYFKGCLDKFGEAIEALARANIKIQSLRSDNNDLRTDIEGFRTDIEDLRIKNDNLRKENNGLRGQLVELRLTEADLRNSLDKLSDAEAARDYTLNENAVLNRKISELKQVIIDLAKYLGK